jgi:hypothetical protein
LAGVAGFSGQQGFRAKRDLTSKPFRLGDLPEVSHLAKIVRGWMSRQFEAVQQADYCILQIQALQTTIEQKSDEILPALKQNGYVNEPEVEVTLGGLSSDGVYVFFPKCDVQVNVTANLVPQCAGRE